MKMKPTFINELTKLINKWSSKWPNRDICLKALMVVPSLILQRTSNKCKTSEIKSQVERRLNLWKNKDVESLLNETRSIQKGLPQQQKLQTTEGKAKIFTKLVFKGKVNPAIGLLDDDTSSGSFAAFSRHDKNITSKARRYETIK